MTAGEIIGWLFTGIAAAWLAVEKLLPYLAKSWVRSKQTEQEARQNRDTDAFKQTLGINEKLITFFIETIDKTRSQYESSYEKLGGRLDKVEIRLENIMTVISRTKTELEISTRERVQLDEVLSDIDVILHEIRAAQQAKGGNYDGTDNIGIDIDS